ncbi:MAG: HlyC/CorC family transporter [Lachnospiraceae bacterium]|jgi:putative hemolysin|uniref:HlyC/CorC family transporter n=1 Tax=Hominisplanchenecus murintestinalis TaxID=2941517 RepID=A0AC61QVL3_9FIRM|nr:hemolysin family protein [Hominisplanchenecus murintestinalis]MCI9517592.1 HlyC/CorC family transporter [Lachnospiraceae bacterium]RKJ75397.1 HlyC/CorC family transporter [Anaerotruncus sp. 1XD22-93]MCI9662158.1 HlyC/CorC family transporter [Lachnospiraceae bacterium]NBH99686.1 HlyC/CorC family transporter [Lachnospiraceae bacterium]NBI76977.1 HlyC/CorC family transporter [Lachnospiraceae bacterium]
MDDGGSQIVAGLILLTIFLVLEFILTAFLSALDTVSESDIKEKDGTKAEWLLKIRDNPKSMINTFHVTIVFFAAFLGCFAAYGAAEFWRGELHIPVLICELAIAVFLFVVLGIQFPRALGTYKGKEILFRLAVPAKVLLFLFYPIAAFIQGCVYLLALPFGVNTKEMPEDVTEEEIISMVNEGHEQGVLEANEAEMITNIVEFGDKEAQDVMTHRTNIVGVDGKINLKSAIQFMLDATNSRFPVYEEGMDNITGIIHLKDAMRCHTAGNYDEWLIKDIPGLIRQAVFIPKTRKINLLFKNMQSKKLQMVIVADEYGQTAGLVALEDILEEIVGNIQDEYDEDVVYIEEQADGSFLADGMTPLEELEDRLGITFKLEEDIGTLNGYLVSKLDKIPAEDEKSVIEDMGYSFQILSVARKKIQRARIRKLLENTAPAVPEEK